MSGDGQIAHQLPAGEFAAGGLHKGTLLELQAPAFSFAQSGHCHHLGLGNESAMGNLCLFLSLSLFQSKSLFQIHK